MNISNLSILKKVTLVVVLMGVAAAAIAAVGAQGLGSLGASLKDTGAREEVAREAMDLRVDIIAISRMTYQLALAPEKAADFQAETEKRSGEMLARLPKIASTADANETKLLDGIRTTLDSYFNQIRAMVAVAGSDAGKDPAVMKAELGKALDAQKIVTAAVKEYSTYSATTLATSRADALAASTQTMLVLMATAAVCIVAGVAVSFLLARRGIVNPIRSLTGIMSDMAAGKLGETIPGTDRKDEIGEMARALEVFRANEQQMRAMEAQEAALHAQSKDLQSSISGIVAAAAAGDFSKRIAKSYDDADLKRFAETLEKVCVDTVESGFMTKDLALLVGPDHETVLAEQGNIDTVHHAEATLARTASLTHPPDYLWGCTLVTTFEPCAMCTGTLYWANIGRIVYGASEEALLALTGNHEENPTLSLPCRDVIARGQKAIEVIGPIAALEAEMLEPHRDFWSRR